MSYPPGGTAPTAPFNGTEACASTGLALFFTIRSQKDLERAKALCASCPMQPACDEWALEREEFGFWAGRTQAERKRIRRERRIVLHRPEAHGTRSPSEQALAA